MVKSLDGEVVPPDDSESEREASYVIILCIYGYHCNSPVDRVKVMYYCIEASYYVIVVIIINSLINI